MATGYGVKSIVTNGLVFCIDFKNTKSYPGSGTAVTDLSHGTDASLSGNPTFNSSGHLELDGVSDFVNGNANISNLGFSGDQPFSILCWAKPDVTQPVEGHSKVIVGFGTDNNSSPAGKRLALFILGAGQQSGNDHKLGIAWWDAHTVLSNYVVSDTMTHMACTYAGGGRTTSNSAVYVNGASRTLSGGTSSNLNLDDMDWFYMGVDHSANSQEMKGDIAIVQVYNRALSASEISQNFNAQRGRFGV